MIFEINSLKELSILLKNIFKELERTGCISGSFLLFLTKSDILNMSQREKREKE